LRKRSDPAGATAKKYELPVGDGIRYDKQLLPKAMQLRRGEFGKKGQASPCCDWFYSVG